MKNIISLLTVTSLAISTLFAQAPTIEWQKTIGGSGYDILYTIQATPDGGYILSGSSNSDSSGDKTVNKWGYADYWVVKIDSSRNIQWQKDFGGTDTVDSYVCISKLPTITLTVDGGYLLGGSSNCNISGNKTETSKGSYDYWIIKLNAAGQTEWQKDIGGNESDLLYSMQQSTDGGYILGGTSRSDIFGDKTENSIGADYWIVKLDLAGNMQWQNTIGGNQVDALESIQQTTDGGYIVGGSSTSSISGDKTEASSLYNADYWVLKLNAAGNIEWQRTLNNEVYTNYAYHYDFVKVVRQTADGGYIFGGTSYQSISDFYGAPWIIKLNPMGSVEWQKLISDALGELKDLQTTADGYILTFAESPENSPGGGVDCLVIKMGFTGNIQWQKTIGGDYEDVFTSIQRTADGGYVLGGYSFSDISGDKTENSRGGADYWVIKLSSELVPTTELSSKATLTTYPNPTADAVFVRTEIPVTLSLYNAFGQTILTQIVQDGEKMDLSTLPNGLYFLVETTTGQTHKVLKTSSGE